MERTKVFREYARIVSFFIYNSKKKKKGEKEISLAPTSKWVMPAIQLGRFHGNFVQKTLIFSLRWYAWNGLKINVVTAKVPHTLCYTIRGVCVFRGKEKMTQNIVNYYYMCVIFGIWKWHNTIPHKLKWTHCQPCTEKVPIQIVPRKTLVYFVLCTFYNPQYKTVKE